MKIVIKILLSLFFLFIIFFGYLSLIGIETKKFNNQISNKIKEFDQHLDIKLKKIKIIFNPIDFKFSAKTIGPKIINKDIILDFESIKAQIPLKSLFSDKFIIENLEISTKPLEVKKMTSLARSFTQNTELYFFEKFLKKGFLIANIKIEFNENGKLKNNYKINGIVRDVKIDVFKKFIIDDINFKFDLVKDNLNFKNIKFALNEVEFSSKKLVVKNDKNNFLINGQVENKIIDLTQDQLDFFIKPYLFNLDLTKFKFSSNSRFSFKINDKLRLRDLAFETKLKLNEMTSSKVKGLEIIFPELSNSIKFLNHEVIIVSKKNNLSVDGFGDILLQKQNDNIKYSIKKINDVYSFSSLFKIKKNPLEINFLNYQKKENTELNIEVKGENKINDKIKFDSISLIEEENKINAKKLIFNKDLKIIDLDSFKVNYLDKENVINNFELIKKDRDFFLKGPILNANYLIKNLLDNDQSSTNILKKSFLIHINVAKLQLDQNHKLDNFEGSLAFKDQEIINGDLKGYFDAKKKLRFTVNSESNQKITTLFVDQAEVFVNRYKFVKGFSGGLLDFYSSKKGDESISTIKIYDFKLKELPVLTKILTLASLQGIADLMSGEGIGFDEFEMQFKSNKNLITINEVYAIGPAISILMNGYVEKDKLISLRGTLIPATTINKVIGSIPILGQILVGSKTGEGVFGVSFKIKGSQKNLETSVNPIKTLTPRFITRTLERIKKIN